MLGVSIDVVTPDEAVSRVSDWAAGRESRYVCLCNVHSVVTASDDAALAAALHAADLVTADGAPVSWMLRRQGAASQSRVSGPDLMLDYCRAAAARGEPMFLLGGTPETLRRLEGALTNRFPGLVVAGALSPPFRPLSPGEEQEIVDSIHASDARTVWVGMGCPKQEILMHRLRGRLRAVTLGVGAAFDFHAGVKPRAPRWMRERGLEWLHRLVSEPRRLWKRYLVTNGRFLAGAMRQLLTPQPGRR